MLKLTSTPNQVPNPITYSLRYDPFNGTVEDCSNGSVKCTIQTSRTSSSHTTTVSSPIEDVVAVIDWGTLTKSMSVKLHGQSIPGGAFIASRSGGLLKSTEHVWKDESGGEFSWQKGLVSVIFICIMPMTKDGRSELTSRWSLLQCFNPQKEVVAQFTPKRFHAFHTDE